MAGRFDGIWKYARSLIISAPDGSQSRPFLGFLEPISLTDPVSSERRRPFILPKEKFRLISEPGEDFYGGGAVYVSCAGEMFEVLSVKPVYIGGEITHRESVLVRTGEAASDG